MAKSKEARNQVVIGLYKAGRSIKEIAEKIGITEGGVKGLLGRLAEKGLIERGKRRIARAPEKEKARKPEVLKTREPEKQRTKEPEEWQKGKTQISLWLPDRVALDLKVRALREKRRLSDLGSEIIQKGLKK